MHFLQRLLQVIQEDWRPLTASLTRSLYSDTVKHVPLSFLLNEFCFSRKKGSAVAVLVVGCLEEESGGNCKVRRTNKYYRKTSICNTVQNPVSIRRRRPLTKASAESTAGMRVLRIQNSTNFSGSKGEKRNGGKRDQQKAAPQLTLRPRFRNEMRGDWWPAGGRKEVEE